MVVGRNEHRRSLSGRSPVQALQQQLHDKIEQERVKAHRNGKVSFAVPLSDKEANTDVWQPVAAAWEDAGWTVKFDHPRNESRLDFS
jgi:hypothetical protein